MNRAAYRGAKVTPDRHGIGYRTRTMLMVFFPVLLMPLVLYTAYVAPTTVHFVNMTWAPVLLTAAVIVSVRLFRLFRRSYRIEFFDNGILTQTTWLAWHSIETIGEKFTVLGYSAVIESTDGQVEFLWKVFKNVREAQRLVNDHLPASVKRPDSMTH
jgi:hypothetical protein